MSSEPEAELARAADILALNLLLQEREGMDPALASLLRKSLEEARRGLASPDRKIRFARIKDGLDDVREDAEKLAKS